MEGDQKRHSRSDASYAPKRVDLTHLVLSGPPVFVLARIMRHELPGNKPRTMQKRAQARPGASAAPPVDESPRKKARISAPPSRFINPFGPHASIPLGRSTNDILPPTLWNAPDPTRPDPTRLILQNEGSVNANGARVQPPSGQRIAVRRIKGVEDGRSNQLSGPLKMPTKAADDGEGIHERGPSTVEDASPHRHDIEPLRAKATAPGRGAHVRGKAQRDSAQASAANAVKMEMQKGARAGEEDQAIIKFRVAELS
ncbi:hypothetical protein C8F04DRAFT_1293637 [Mycena alexandri]|uniref:Uncharacterized protein n=1 Tax=Mycena alexandri TaxID=1745969 RepID=A0AAD6TAT8_9AGAR|nr:hypothetical protein C8F04DRAFT_1293637 [Mycena alexandri]